MDWVRSPTYMRKRSTDKDPTAPLSGRAKQHISNFIRCVCAAEPVFQLCPYQLAGIMSQGKSEILKNQEQFMQYSPLLYYVIWEVWDEISGQEQWQPWFWDLLTQIGETAQDVMDAKLAKLDGCEIRRATDPEKRAYHDWIQLSIPISFFLPGVCRLVRLIFSD